MSIARLHEEIILEISEYLSNVEKINLSMSTKIFDNLRCKYIYRNKVDIAKILTLPYFDNFESVTIHTYTVLPKRAKNIHFCITDTLETIPLLVTHMVIIFNYPIFSVYMSTLTHLTFDDCFNRLITGISSLSITHLTFGNSFNQSIEGHLPSTLTHLIFGNQFNKPIKKAIPHSVTHLCFGNDFDRSIDDCLKSVTHLIFGRNFDQPIHCRLPFTLTHLFLDASFNYTISNIPPSVILLALPYSYNNFISVDAKVEILRYNFLTYPSHLDFRHFKCYDYLYE
uniref:F-box domain-containing protein n=1 Tax=viral metagenome TaxID=1070528 RepID=A0A6C0CAB6_9ZZZZ